jgi:predicted Fe-S protein YdhL (DUF1289 family)
MTPEEVEMKTIMEAWNTQDAQKRERVFAFADSNGDQKVSLDEYRNMIVKTGMFRTEAELHDWFKLTDTNNDTMMELQEVIAVMIPEQVNCPANTHMHATTQTCVPNSGTNPVLCPTGEYFDHAV